MIYTQAASPFHHMWLVAMATISSKPMWLVAMATISSKPMWLVAVATFSSNKITFSTVWPEKLVGNKCSEAHWQIDCVLWVWPNNHYVPVHMNLPKVSALTGIAIFE